MARALVEVIRDLLDERSADPRFDLLATELLSLSVRPTAAELFDLLSDEAPTVVRERVPRLFVEGRNVAARVRIEGGEDEPRMAVLPLVTSKPVVDPGQPGHAGYGLFFASEVAVRNGGTFRITSGNRSLSLFQSGGRRRAVKSTHAAWSGTVVAMLLHLDNVISILDVYRTLPEPKGYEPEDFFA